MAGTKEIKRRIKSVKNTKKITKAMELVSASKMKRAVSSTLASRMYAKYSWEILKSVAMNLKESKNPFFMEREKNEGEKEKILIALISSNRGLCGAYNSQIIKKAISLLKIKNDDVQFDFITIGKKGDMAMRRVDKNIIASFLELPDNVSLSDIVSISKLIMDEYGLLHYSKVLIAYTDYVSALSQKPNIKQILPISGNDLEDLIASLEMGKEKVEENKNEPAIEYLFEGDFEPLISSLGAKITQMQIYQMILESNASEQSARMMAMKNASEASGEMIDDLTLMFNKARQANITREISEISAGMVS